MRIVDAILPYVGALAILAVIDWMMPDNFQLFAFRLFKTGLDHDKAFSSFYNRRLIFRAAINAIAFYPVFFTKLGDVLIFVAIAIYLLQILIDTLRAEMYARRQMK